MSDLNVSLSSHRHNAAMEFCRTTIALVLKEAGKGTPVEHKPGYVNPHGRKVSVTGELSYENEDGVRIGVWIEARFDQRGLVFEVSSVEEDGTMSRKYDMDETPSTIANTLIPLANRFLQ